MFLFREREVVIALIDQNVLVIPTNLASMGSSLVKGVSLFCTRREVTGAGNEPVVTGLPEICVALRKKLSVYAHNGAQYAAKQDLPVPDVPSAWLPQFNSF